MSCIAIVDDNVDISAPVGMLLRHAGHTAVCCEGGLHALNFLRQTKPDLLILDVMMPEVDGLELLQSVRSDAQLHDLPVVMFSAIADTQTIASAMKMGAHDYLVKGSWHWPDLLQRIESLLPKKDDPAH